MVPNAFRNFSTVVRRTFPNLMEAFVKKVLHRSSSKKAATAGAARKTLFAPVVPSEKRSPSFEQVRTFPGSEPTRWMLDDVYDGFTDPDGNFLEQFQDDEALALTDAALSGYVYGVQHSWHLTKEAKLVVEAAAVETHEIGGKRIPSNFFARPGTEHVSAVLFTNTGTTAKFARMG